MGKFSKLARSHNLDFLNVSVLSDTVVYSAIPYEKIKAYIIMFLRRSLVHISYMYMIFFFFFYVGTFGVLPPPPPYQKAGYATVASFRSPEEWPNEDGRFRPPPPPPPPPPHTHTHTRYTKSPPLSTSNIKFIFRYGNTCKFFSSSLAHGKNSGRCTDLKEMSF